MASPTAPTEASRTHTALVRLVTTTCDSGLFDPQPQPHAAALPHPHPQQHSHQDTLRTQLLLRCQDPKFRMPYGKRVEPFVEKGLHVVLQECSFLKPLFLDVEGVEERYDEDTVEALWQLLQFFADGHFVDAYVEDGDTGLGPLRSVRKWRLCQTSLRATFLGFLYLVLLAQSVIKQHQAPRIVKFNAFLTICLNPARKWNFVAKFVELLSRMGDEGGVVFYEKLTYRHVRAGKAQQVQHELSSQEATTAENIFIPVMDLPAEFKSRMCSSKKRFPYRVEGRKHHRKTTNSDEVSRTPKHQVQMSLPCGGDMDLASASGILSSETGEKRKPEDPSLSLLLLPDGNSAVVDCAPPPALASASLFADGVPDPLMPAAAAPPCPLRNLSLMEEKLCVALPWLLMVPLSQELESLVPNPWEVSSSLLNTLLFESASLFLTSSADHLCRCVERIRPVLERVLLDSCPALEQQSVDLSPIFSTLQHHLVRLASLNEKYDLRALIVRCSHLAMASGMETQFGHVVSSMNPLRGHPHPPPLTHLPQQQVQPHQEQQQEEEQQHQHQHHLGHQGHQEQPPHNHHQQQHRSPS